MPGKFKTEAVVLRSIRYGEADRILHLYSAPKGRIGAIAKGSRKPRSRFGGRLEPFFRLDLILHEGRGDLATVTAADTVAAHANLRGDGAALGAAARGCDAVLRLCDSQDPNPLSPHRQGGRGHRTTPHGQGGQTTIAQLAADELGVPIEDVEVLAGHRHLPERLGHLRQPWDAVGMPASTAPRRR